jgi:hypothetical protein
MTQTNANEKNSAGRTDENKKAIIKIDEPGSEDALVIEAEHFIINDQTGLVSIYESARSSRIDRQTHVSRVSINRVDTLPDFDFFSDVDEINTAGDYQDIVEHGDWVRINGCDDSDTTWRVDGIYGETAVLDAKGQPVRNEDVEDLDIVQKHDRDRTLSEQRRLDRRLEEEVQG